MRHLTLLFVVALVTAACSGDEAATTTSTTPATPVAAITTEAPTTTSPAETTTPAAPTAEATAAVTVTYDGNNCVYNGPDELDAGPLDINYVNDSDHDVGLHAARLNEGVTYGEYQEDVEANADLDPISTTILWLNRDFEGLENRGELSETVAVVEGVHALTCVGWIATDGPPDLHIHVGTIPVAPSA